MVVAILLTLEVVGCGSPTPEEKASVEYAELVEVKGFRQVEGHVKAEDSVRHLIGPADVDLFSDASAPGWSPEPRSSAIPNNDPRYDQVILNHSQIRDGWKCRVGIGKLRSGVAPRAGEGVTEDEARRVQAGELAFLELIVGCRRA